MTKCGQELDKKKTTLKELQDKEKKAITQHKKRNIQAETQGIESQFNINRVHELLKSPITTTIDEDTPRKYDQQQLASALKIAQIYEDTARFCTTRCYQGNRTKSRVFSGPLVGSIDLDEFVSGLTVLCSISDHNSKSCTCKFRINAAKAVIRIDRGSSVPLSNLFEAAGGRDENRRNASLMLQRIAYVPMVCFRTAGSSRSVYDSWRVVDRSVQNPHDLCKILDVVHPIQPTGALPSISVSEFRAVRSIASGETEKKLMNLIYMKCMPPHVNRAAFGSQWQTEYKKLESGVEDALALFGAFDEMAKNHVLHDAAVVFPHLISEQDVEEEMDRLNEIESKLDYEYEGNNESDIDEIIDEASVSNMSDKIYAELTNMDPRIECDNLIDIMKGRTAEHDIELANEFDLSCGESTLKSDEEDNRFDPDDATPEDLMKDAVHTSPSVFKCDHGGRKLLIQRIAYWRRWSLSNGRKHFKKMGTLKRNIHSNRKTIESIYPDIKEKVRIFVFERAFTFQVLGGLYLSLMINGAWSNSSQVEKVLLNMGCGAHPQRNTGTITVNTKKKKVCGSGAVALKNGLRAFGIEVSVNGARYLGTKGDQRLHNAKRYGILASDP